MFNMLNMLNRRSPAAWPRRTIAIAEKPSMRKVNGMRRRVYTMLPALSCACIFAFVPSACAQGPETVVPAPAKDHG